jgi:predicted nucleic acid-binding protein
MRRVYADTSYWIALANPRDQHHAEAVRLSDEIQPLIVTSDEVLAEFLTYYSRRGSFWRQKAVELVKAIQEDPNVKVVPQTRNSFLEGLTLYQGRPDKDYSSVDCISMAAMRKEEIAEVLSADRHFEQEGFTRLFRIQDD